MMRQSHLAVSATGALASVSILHHAQMLTPHLPVDPVAVGIALVAGASGGVLPDIDIKIPAALPRAFFWLITLPIPPLHRKMMHPNFEFGHRTWSHNLFAAGTVIAIAFLLSRYVLCTMLDSTALRYAEILLMSYAYGYIWHLVADSTTRSGIPLFWPFWMRKLHLLPDFLRITTGKSMLEGAYAFILSAFCIYLAIGQFF